MGPWPAHVYRSKAKELGLSETVVEEALRQARVLESRKLPVILSLGHLARHTDSSYQYLHKCVQRATDPYRSFRIKKRSGGRRLICVPEPALMKVQKWISKYVLNVISPDPASTAFAPGSSILDCATRHCGCTWLVKLDIERFFESVSEIQAFRVFLSLGYNPLVSFEMARLCSRVFKKTRRVKRNVWTANDRYALGQYHHPQIGHLPQGAPTSPMLANLSMRGLDGEINNHAMRMGFTYTRYADDLTLSSNRKDLRQDICQELLRWAQRQVRMFGLMPNRSKSVIAPPGARKVVLGLLVDGNHPRLAREFKNRLLLHAHYLTKFGPGAHASARSFNSIWSMHRHIKGLLAYARYVEPTFAERVEKQLTRVDWGPLEPT